MTFYVNTASAYNTELNIHIFLFLSLLVSY